MNPCSSEKIIKTLWGMKKDQLAESTIEVAGRRLRLMAKSGDLDNPDAVTEYLAKKEGKNSYIESLANAYYRYAKYNEIFWKQPIIKRSSQPPYIPTTEEITALISDAGKKYSLILTVLKDTGMRPIEIERTKLKWLDLNRGTINVETAKHGNGRTLKVKDHTLAMLKEYICSNNFNLNDNIFPKVKTMRRVFTTLRKRTAEKLKNPNIQRISMYSFRHYFATMLYHKTKSILLVKQQLGHKRIENTLVYTHLVNFSEDEYETATASTVEETCKLINVGYEYVTEMDGVKIFRKPK
jgi:integrase